MLHSYAVSAAIINMLVKCSPGIRLGKDCIMYVCSYEVDNMQWYTLYDGAVWL